MFSLISVGKLLITLSKIIRFEHLISCYSGKGVSFKSYLYYLCWLHILRLAFCHICLHFYMTHWIDDATVKLSISSRAKHFWYPCQLLMFDLGFFWYFREANSVNLSHLFQFLLSNKSVLASNSASMASFDRYTHFVPNYKSVLASYLDVSGWIQQLLSSGATLQVCAWK